MAKPRIKPDFQVCGIDWGGLGGDPFVMEVGVRIGGKHWWNIHEEYHPHITLPQIIARARYVHETYKVKMFWCGGDEPRVVEYLRGEGFNAMVNFLTNKPGSVEYGLRVLQSLLGQGLFENDPSRCPNLEQEIGLLHYARNRQGVPTKKTRGKDHCIDAVRYYLTGEGETPEKEDVPLEERPAVWLDAKGWHENPAVINAQKSKLAGDPDAWWDEVEEQQDGKAYLEELNQYLGITTEILE